MKCLFSEEEKELFFERHFDVEAERDENLEVAEQICASSKKRIAELTECLMDGEVIDEPTMILELSNLILATEFKGRF